MRQFNVAYALVCPFLYESSISYKHKNQYRRELTEATNIKNFEDMYISQASVSKIICFFVVPKY